MTKRSTLGGGALLALALLFIGLTVLFNYALRGWRLDLTAEPALHHRAPAPTGSWRASRSRSTCTSSTPRRPPQQLPQLKTYGTRVREFLEELAARSNGKLHLHVIDPQPFSEEEDRAAELGVRGAPVGRGRQPVLLRTRRHQLHRRPRGHRVLRSQQGTVPRVRRRQARLPARQSRRSRWSAWLSTLPMDGGLRSAERAHARAVGGVQRGEAAVRRAPAASRPRPGSTRTSTCWCWCIRRSSSPATAVRDRPVRAARRTHPGVRRSARRGRHCRRRPAATRWRR